MARKLRLQYEGAIYHITVRGNRRRRIFLDDRDRHRFLWRLAESRDMYGVRLYLYCLMGGHVHLLAETPRANISRFMQSVLTGYTVYFNLRHHTCGHLVQGRYGSQLVDGDLYLLRLSRYVHLNPVRTREARAWSVQQKRQWLRAYRWSSYRGYVDEAKAGEVVEYAPLLAMMERPEAEWRRRYRAYVETGLAETDQELVDLLKESPRAVGDRVFRRWVDAEYKKLRENQAHEQDISFRREAVVRDAEGIVTLVASVFGVAAEDMRRQMRRNPARPVAAYLLCKYAGLTQREAGKRLGYGTGAAVSLQLKQLRETRGSDSGTERSLSLLERKILKMT